MTQQNKAKQPNLLIKTFQSLRKRGLLRTIVRIVKYPFDPFMARQKEKRVFGHTNIEDRFTEIYKRNYWDHEESISGSASTLFYTENLRKNLPELFAKFSIKSVFDAPCGDFNWMRYVIKDYPIDYIGGDIVLPLIKSNYEMHKTSNIQFVHIDLTKDQFPSANLMICRDCLFHLSYEDTKAVLKKFVESNIYYLLTSTHINSKNFANKDIKTGSFRHIDLFSAPFNFPQNVLYRILDWREPEPEDWREPEPEREMCLWSREQIISALNTFN